MVRLKIKVTEDILDQSKYCEGEIQENCAISLAIRDIFPNAQVEEKGIYLDKGRWRDNFHNSDPDITLPKKAVLFIREFDCLDAIRRVNMRPIEFELQIPDRIINKINIDELRSLLIDHPTLELMP